MEHPRVLLVEDDDAVAKALTLRLQTKGFEVLPAADGEAAMQAVADSPPDILLLDINLPGRDGFDVATHVRSRLDQLPIVFITASRNTELRTRAEQFERSWFVEKPFTSAYLIDVVRQAAALAY
ncbi:MAG: response regulator [Pseudomonadales bacterium]